MKPNASTHNPSSDYLRSLIEGAGISQRQAAEAIGIAPRTMRAYLSGFRPIPYTVQYAIEQLCSPVSGAHA